MSTTREDREKVIAQMNANSAIEDLGPDESDKRMQQQFIDGTASLEDLLNHAQAFALKSGGQQ